MFQGYCHQCEQYTRKSLFHEMLQKINKAISIVNDTKNAEAIQVLEDIKKDLECKLHCQDCNEIHIVK